MAESASLAETARRSIDIWLAFSQAGRRDDPEYLDVWVAYSAALAALTMAVREAGDGPMRQAAADMAAAVLDMAADRQRLPELAEQMTPLHAEGRWDTARIATVHDRALVAVRDYMADVERDSQSLQ